MCILKKTLASSSASWASAGASDFTRFLGPDGGLAPADRPTGSGRRKLWQLSPQAACPIVGVCLRLPDLVRLARKVGIDTAGMGEYDLHITVVGECKKRSRLAEVVQKELESRFAGRVDKARKLKSTDELDAWCCHELGGAHLAGVLWATLTHARCTPELEYELLGRVHMIQHQVGMVVRADHSQLEALASRKSSLEADLRDARDRIAAQAAEWSSRQQAWSVEESRLRAEVASLNAALSRALGEVESFVRAVPDLGERMQLSQANEQLQAQVRELRKELAKYRDGSADERHGRGQEETPRMQEQTARHEPCLRNAMLDGKVECVALQRCTVLCVGGRAANIPAYRELVEHKGARFLHHDGGEEDSISRLSSDLTTADLVLCQVGCIGHNAYWRVKEHCKRHNKPCVFLQTPSRAALERALNVLDGDTAAGRDGSDAG